MINRHTRNLLKHIAANVRRAREARLLSQRKLAKAAGLGARFLQQIEAASVNLSIDALGRIAGALGVPITSLLKRAKHFPRRGPGRPKLKVLKA